MDLAMLKLVLDFAVIPLAIFGYKLNSRLEGISAGLSSIRNDIEKLGELIRDSERDNRAEHKDLGERIHQLDTTNRVEHAILSNGGKL